ncbi:PepSY domain-containing protein [Flocculibacter collagenilyticus]|uniref:PepSY domain-containing protein n=1 Tax=Flocculibacter collagenilyticus TaxID=2744479 RepID=UPI0018F77AEE|nr:PepSY domain-containing protein [Flocculibacter collagenilyticus]
MTTNTPNVPNTFSLASFARKYHKWLMALLGVQFLIWCASGVYMVVVDIDYIHGDHLVAKPLKPIDATQIHYSINQLTQDYPAATNIMLTQHLASVLGQPTYQFSYNNQIHLVGATTGQLLPPINEAQARAIALDRYTTNSSKPVKINSVTLFTEQAPDELSTFWLPAWQVTFDTLGTETFYINQYSGQVITKRHTAWRIFDWMWRLHIMEYETGHDVDNLLLRWFTVFGIAAAIFGGILSYIRFTQRTPHTKGVRHANH